LSFNNIRDEGTTDASSLDLSGTIVSELVELITINGKQAEISADKSFSVA
jgi:hypothetical protein